MTMQKIIQCHQESSNISLSLQFLTGKQRKNYQSSKNRQNAGKAPRRTA